MASGGGGGGGGGGRVVGDYMLGRQIGTGAFSIVWRARHRLRGTEVAVKEIVMDRLSKKLQDNLLSEVSILRRINHPNIIALYDFVQVSGRIYLVLEYCKGGDLSVYIQNHGIIPEATAKHFMRQLASGLQVLRDNNVIHRDLKPQNLLISTYDDNAVLKIADFGFARSLQPRGLAETLCGSPLYMAPEVMQSQKYDAKADLWSVGVILYQLVTGKTPFTGNSQLQLQQNIMKANELHFPSDCKLSRDCIDLCQKLLRRNAVERLTFEEFFNHQFLSEHTSHGSETSRLLSHTRNDFPLECGQASLTSGSSHDDCLPFPLDDESSVHDINKSLSLNKGSMRCTYGFSVDNRLRKSPSNSPSKNIGNPSGYSSKGKAESAGFRHDPGRFPIGSTKEMNFAIDQRPINVSSKDPIVMDSLELDQDYVLVPGPPLDMSSSSVSASRIRNSPCKSETSPIASPHYSALSAPMPITGAVIRNAHGGSLGSHSSPASGTSQGSMDVGDVMEQPSADCMTRIRSLQQYTSVIAELVKDKAENGRQLDAFAMQLVILAIWKQGLAICHAQVASAIEGSVSQEIEREFLHGVGHAEELAMDVGHMAEATEMPDAIEMIFQSALTLGRLGAVDEMMGNSERASCRYSKAVCLLHFLLVEAPSLALNPPLSLTNSDRHRLRSYIEVLSNRHSQSRFQRMGLKCEDQ